MLSDLERKLISVFIVILIHSLAFALLSTPCLFIIVHNASKFAREGGYQFNGKLVDLDENVLRTFAAGNLRDRMKFSELLQAAGFNLNQPCGKVFRVKQGFNFQSSFCPYFVSSVLYLTSVG